MAILDVPTTLYLEECEAHRATLAAYVAMRRRVETYEALLKKFDDRLVVLGTAGTLDDIGDTRLSIKELRKWQARIATLLATAPKETSDAHD